jgi:hypothetical protein
MPTCAAPFELPAGYSRVRVVNSFEELLAQPLDHGVNALCWRRSLPGDFEEVVAQLGAADGIDALDDARLAGLKLSAAGRAAADLLREDRQRLLAHGLSPSLDCIHGYPRDEDAGPVPIDVYSFHADSATVPTDTYLCSYTEAASEALRNEDAQRCIDVPETRAALLKTFGGAEGPEFREWLADHCYDLHYVPVANAQPFSFGLGNLWRIAVDYPGNPVPPCIHRAPTTRPEQRARLLLIS